MDERIEEDGWILMETNIENKIQNLNRKINRDETGKKHTDKSRILHYEVNRIHV